MNQDENLQSGEPIQRSERFMLHYQISALCESIQFLIQHDQKPGVRTHALIKKLTDDTLALTHGRCVDPPPTIEESDSIADWLVVANHLRAMSIAFLTPEEQEESQRFGFALNAPQQ